MTHATAPGLSVIALRYFNPIGAHPSGSLGEDPQGIPEQRDAVHDAGRGGQAGRAWRCTAMTMTRPMAAESVTTST